jgi:hypothetical protein
LGGKQLVNKSSSYLLQHHTINGKPLTFSVPNYDTTKALSHRPCRPWQKAVIEAIYGDSSYRGKE